MKTSDGKEKGRDYISCSKETDLNTCINGLLHGIGNDKGYLGCHGDEDGGEAKSAETS
jgi:hypothetical protein